CLSEQDLPEKEQIILRKNYIKVPGNNPTFDYPKFLRILDYYDIYCGVRAWFGESLHWGDVYGENWAIFTKMLCHAFMKRSPAIQRLAINTGIMHDVPSKYLIITGLPGAEQCLSQLREFICVGDFDMSEIFL